MTFRYGGIEGAGYLMERSDRLIVRLTAARLCRNMYFIRGDAQDRFFKAGLGKFLIDLLEKSDAEFCDETISNILDFVMTRESKINQLHVDYLMQNGLGEAMNKARVKHKDCKQVMEKLKFMEDALM